LVVVPFEVSATGPEFLPLLEALLAQLFGTECGQSVIVDELRTFLKQYPHSCNSNLGNKNKSERSKSDK
jgi:hypothetical protein